MKNKPEGKELNEFDTHWIRITIVPNSKMGHSVTNLTLCIAVFLKSFKSSNPLLGYKSQTYKQYKYETYILRNISILLYYLLLFTKINICNRFFQGFHQYVKQFRSRSGPMFCWAWSWSKLIAKVISRAMYDQNLW